MRPYVPLYAASLDVGYLGVGVVASAIALLPMFLALPVGGLVDRWSPRPLIVIGACLSGASYLVLWAVPGFAVIIASQLVAGLANLLIVLSAQSYVGSLGQGAAAERNFAIYTIYASIGQIGGPLAGGLLISWVGFGGAFLAAAGFSSLALTATLLTMPRTARRPSATMRKVPRTAMHYLAQGPTRLAIMVSCLMSVPEILRTSFIPIYLDQAVGLDPAHVGWVLALFSVAGLVSKTLLPRIVNRFGRQATLFCITAFCSLTVAALPVDASLIFVSAIVVTMGLTFGLGRPLSMAMAANSASADDMGVVIGLRLTGNRIADFALPLGFGAVAALATIGAAFVTGAAAMMLGTAALIPSVRAELASRRLARRRDRENGSQSAGSPIACRRESSGDGQN